jgi:predicted ATP-grasp superfamily ATP-dependent carboligase
MATMAGPGAERRTILLTGGRAPATLDLARLVAAAGHRVIVAESLAWPITRGSRAVHRHYRVPPPRQATGAFAAALLDIVRAECVDLVVPTCEEVFHLARVADGLRPHVRVLVAPFCQLRRLHSKLEFIESVRKAGLGAPETNRVSSAAEAAERVRCSPGELVLKPEFSRFATEVFIRPRDADVVARLPISPERPWVVQQYVAGEQVCSYSVAHEGRLTAHTAYGVTYTAGVASSIRFVVRDDPRLEEWVTRFVAAERLTGQVAFDFAVPDEGGVMPLECNPRSTSGIHLFADQPELATAFLDPEMPTLRANPSVPRMLAIPMLLYGFPQAVKHGRVGRFLRDFVSSRDVVFRLGDPLPTLVQAAAVGELAVLALRHRRNLLAASTADIEYNGEDECASS